MTATPTPTLESKLETACAALLRGAEPMLAGGSPVIRLATAHLNQPADPDAEEGEDAAQIPVPDVLVRVKLEPTELSRYGYFEGVTTIEVTDNAQHASEDGFLESLFRACARLFFYREVTDEAVNPPVTRPLCDRGAIKGALSALVEGLSVLGIAPESISTDTQIEGATIKRSITGTFICGQTAA